MKMDYSDILPIPEQLIRNFEPKSSWLSHNSELHGVDHMARVFILQELICDKLEEQGIAVNREVVRWASMAHDVGRIDDGIDLEHGTRSAKWINDNLHNQMSPEMLDMVTYIVHWHVPPDSEAPKMTTELKVLKDADALDRVRLGDLDTRYLRTSVTRELIDLAENLYQAYLDNHVDDAFDAVLKAALSLGAVERGE
jgi:uncharacterized protein